MTRLATPSRRGMAFLECVLGTLLLGLLGSTLAQIASNGPLAQARAKARLDSAELANRLMLEYLYDAGSLPAENSTIEFEGRLYRWSVDHTRVSAKVDAAAGLESDLYATERTLSNLRQVTFTVWPSDTAGESDREPSRLLTSSVSRLYAPEPLNPDPNNMRLLTSPEGLARILQSMRDLQEGLNATTGSDRGGEL